MKGIIDRGSKREYNGKLSRPGGYEDVKKEKKSYRIDRAKEKR